MKKIICLILSLVCLFSFSACWDESPASDQSPSADDGGAKENSPSAEEDGTKEHIPAVGSPIHFQGFDESTRKEDVRALYGTPTTLLEEWNSEEYELTFLGISGIMHVTYMNNSDKLFLASFTVNSKDFETYDDYEAAVEKTIEHFEASLIRLPKQTEENENGKTKYKWHNVSAEYVYTVYYTQVQNADENGNWDWNNRSDATVFQFNRYSIVDSDADAEPIV
ncbi:MAG: hypothetical protein IJW49_05855 [Clostridia bacterium]|nr:hypothetical protein [Clostridia bacterium]